MASLTRFVLRHRKLVILGWLVLMVAGGATSQKAIDRLNFDFSLPGQPGYETSKQILKTYGNGGDQAPLVPILTLPAGSTVQDSRGAVTAAFAAVQKAVPAARLVSYGNTGDERFVTDDGRTTYGLLYVPLQQGFVPFSSAPVAAALRAAAPPGATVQITGLDELASGGDSTGPGVLLETLIGSLGALAVLAFVFASFLALIPMAIAAVSILTTFLILLGLTYVTDVSFIVQFLVALIGLGVAIDYSLIIVTRWREERAHGRENADAVVVAAKTAGVAVIFSGVTVAVGLGALIILPVPFLRSVGLGGMLIPLVSTAVSLTLLPAILGGIGPRVDWPRIRKEGVTARGWSAWGRLMVRRRWVAAGVAGLLMAFLLVQFADIKIGLARSDSLATSGPAYDGLQTLKRGGVPTGVLTPIDILVRGGDPVAVAARAGAVPGVLTAVAPDGPVWRRGSEAIVVVVPLAETVAGSSVAVVKRVRSAVANQPGVIGESGYGPLQIDYNKAVYGNFPLALALIAVVTFILLARAFRSLLLPLKAVLLNVVSVAAALGGMVLFWQLGHGSGAVFNIAATGAITFWVPIMIFAFLYGLSMDYEVFILARMREEYDVSGSTDTAVIEGLGRTGRLVTSAALILFLAFISLAAGPSTDVKVLATGLGVGILLDATVVRALLVPALVSLFGRWNWWLPPWAARILRVPPSAAVPEPRRPVGAVPVGAGR